MLRARSRRALAIATIALLAACSNDPNTGGLGGGNSDVPNDSGALFDSAGVDSVGGQDTGDTTATDADVGTDTASDIIIDDGLSDTTVEETTDAVADADASGDDADAAGEDTDSVDGADDVTTVDADTGDVAVDTDDGSVGDTGDDAAGDTTAGDTTGGDTTGGDTTGGDDASADTTGDTGVSDAVGDTTGGDAGGDTSATPSCKDQCGSFIEGAVCQCDPGCVQKGDCCSDWKALCGCAEAADCDDKDGCTIDACDVDSGLCSSLPKPCDDGKVCTVDACKAGSCVSSPGNDGGLCDDGDTCTETDACAGGVCKGVAKNCDDGNPCTVDACDGKTGNCTHAGGNDGAACADGLPCTTDDACKGGVCVGKAKVCDDGNPCTTDGCAAQTGACTASPVTDGTACDDGNACTANDSCKTGTCSGTGKDCSDANPCTVDTCDPKTQACSHAAATDGAPCSDFDPCTEQDACSKGNCVGKAKVCDDGNPCTVDACDKAGGGCTASPAKDGTVCDDGDVCTAQSACDNGSCKGASIVCDDGQACTEDACDPKSGKCVFTASVNGAPCNDGKPCTSGDACTQGLCAGTPKDCNDGDPCTVDSCDLATGGCKSAAGANGAACDDGNACTAGTTCQSGSCKGGKAICTLQPVWKEDVACDSKVWTMAPDNKEPALGWHIDGTPDTVKPPTGACSLNFNNGKDFAVPDGADASIGAATSLEVQLPQADRIELEFQSYYDTETGVSYDKKWVEVSPDNFQQQAISRQLTTVTAKQWAKQTLTLDAYAGKKVRIRFRFDSVDKVQNSGTGWFVDDLVILAGDKPGSCIGRCGAVAQNGGCGCDAGCAKAGNCCADLTTVCKADCKVDADCDDGSACTKDTCDAGACKSTPLADGSACDDGKICTDGDACIKGLCTGGPKKCDDGDPCTFDTCDALAGCKSAPGATGPCDDGDPCTIKDACTAGKCVGSGKCDDGKPCTIDTCDAKTGACTSKDAADGSICDDGDACTSGDRCKTGVCEAGNPKCADGNPCTLDACDAKTGACTNEKLADGKPCSDGDNCTVGDACKAGTCAGTPGCDWQILWKDDIACDGKGLLFVPDAAEPALGWHVDGTPATVAPKTGTCSLNFNDGKSFAGKGGRVEGSATFTKVVQLPAKGGARLRFWSYHDTESSNSYDKRYVEISNDGFKAQASSEQLPNTGTKTWSEQTLDLSAWSGKSVSLRFRFDSVDGVSNTGAGWFVDDVVIEAGAVTATTCSGDAACDDGDACTVDACTAGKCAYTSAKDGTTCGDGDVCQTASACKAGLCVGKAKVCDDGKPCTYDSCNPGTGCVFVAAASGASCDDGKPCTKDDACTNQGSCAGVAACDDGKPCTVDACDPATGKCSSTLAANGAACDDGLACTTSSACDKGACVGVAKDCDDGDPCTVESCDEAANGKCTYANAADGAPCKDGDPCTLTGTCKDGVCSAKDVCTYQAVFEDGFACGKNEGWTFAPQSKDAVGATPAVVGWDIDATPAAVTPTSAGCTLNFNNGKDFNDGSRVQGLATGKLIQLPQTGKAVLSFTSYFDGETSASYDRTWVYVSSDGFKSAVQVFEIAQPATKAKKWVDVELSLAQWIGQKIQLRFAFDSMDSVGNTGAGWFVDNVKVVVGSGAAAKSCEGRCGLFQPGAGCQCNADCVKFGDCCVDYAPVCTGCKTDKGCDDGNSCTVDTCDVATGLCKNAVAADKTACDDGSVCTEAEACASGVCGGGMAKLCDDKNPCTLDTCDAATGCKSIAAPGSCDDGDPCTNDDACLSGTCGGTPKTCDDGNTCTTDACDAATGLCASTNKADGSLCSDGDVCTSGDVCTAAKCSGKADSCDDGLACTVDACDPKTGCTHKAAADGTACNDGDACTTASTCTGGACIGKNICTSTALFTDTFGCGTKGFWNMVPESKDGTDTAAGVVGWAIDGTPSTVTPKSPACSLNFNDGKDFDNASSIGGVTVASARVQGTATLASQVQVPTGLGAELALWSYADCETSQSYDKRFVEISDDNFVQSVQSVQLANGAAAKAWRLETIDLRRWLGKTVKVRFRFDSIDAISNSGAGWFIDDVSVRSKGLPACKVDADCGDGDGCATPVCKAGTCALGAAKPDGTACSDGDACSEQDACKSGICAGTPKLCNDNKPCTWDACNPSTGVCFAVTASDETPCGDGKVCGAGTCVAKQP